MSTNKHKHAALFELLDKSTLKQPKGGAGGGALKVPSWWSGKNNPEVRVQGAAPVAGVAAAPAVGAGAGEAAKAAAPVGGPPSIRPPVKVVPVEAAPKPSAVGAGVMPRRVFPQTVDPRTVNQGSGGGGRRGGQGVPTWAWISAGVVVVLVLLVLAMIPWGGRPVGGGGAGHGMGPVLPPPGQQVPHFDVVRPGAGGAKVPPRPPVVVPPPEPVVEAGHVGRVVPANEVRRVAGNYYAVMVSARSEAVALDNAKFIAERGVDVWIKAQPTGFYSVVSVASFGKLTDPGHDALARRIVEISHQHPEFLKRQRGPYDGAYFTRTP